MKKLLSLIISAALVAGTAQQATADPVAVLEDASKQVALQSENGVSAASAGASLAYGDRVITGPEGNAVVSFPAGKCLGKHQVPPSTLATVSENTCLDFVTGAKAELEWTTVAIVAGLAIGGGVLAYELTQNNKPKSP